MKGIITIIVIIILIVVGFLMLSDGTSTETVVEEVVTEEVVEDSEEVMIDTTGEVMVVKYNDSGFTPENIEVSAGQVVRFVNESTGNMWVASDNHPTHKIMPEFDNKKAVSAGESYEFTFTKVGEWAYHNHVKPSAVGTVVVK